MAFALCVAPVICTHVPFKYTCHLARVLNVQSSAMHRVA